LDFDLGAIGKGFALDRMAALLADWDCPAHLLVSGGSSILAGQSPVGLPGWSCGLGEDNSAHRFWLVNASVGGSGLAVKGEHILDPRTGGPAPRQRRAWALADTAAESDALSTACMVLDREEVAEVVAANPQWLAILDEPDGIQYLGERPPPARV
jgi:thiamine biosynthesis lipoprotein